MSLLLAIGYWLWSAFIAVGAGLIGAALNCGEGEICESGSPPLLKPWVWGDYEDVPAVRYIALGGLLASSAFVVAVYLGRRVLAVITLLVSAAFLSYPFFAGLTSQGRLLFGFGAVFGLAAIFAMRASARQHS